VKYCS
jgi:hypothetical protein